LHHAPLLTGAQITGEFLPTAIKMLPFFGSLISVSIVFILNSTKFERKTADLYENAKIRGVYRFLSHK